MKSPTAESIDIKILQPGETALVNRIPPHLFFFISAVFHYLGPAFAVLLFAEVSVGDAAWLRIDRID